MVSEKTIIILITIAILLSAVSIAVTVSTVNSKLVPAEPKINIQQGESIPDTDKARVSIGVLPPVAGG